LQVLSTRSSLRLRAITISLGLLQALVFFVSDIVEILRLKKPQNSLEVWLGLLTDYGRLKKYNDFIIKTHFKKKRFFDEMYIPYSYIRFPIRFVEMVLDPGLPVSYLPPLFTF
jgi:hypothetical protein